MGAIANGGVLLRPWIVKEIRHPSGALVRRFGPTVIRRVIEKEVAAELTEILCAVVEQGTGTAAQVPGIRTAGKTGTGQKIDPAGGYSHSRFTASFVGFVPADRPQLVIAAILDEPKPVYPFYFGGVALAPVFKEVARDTLGYLREQFQEDRIQVASSRAGD
jgi:stage V sporulation protein D (sporulation-specific penicillin-binding protein)